MSTAGAPETLWDVLDNSTVAAFAGAFAAFMLVMLSDAVRRRIRKRKIRFLISDLLDLARQKLQTVNGNIDMLRNSLCTDAAIMKFPVELIRQYHFELADLFRANESLALTGLLFWAESIDDLLVHARTSATNIKLAGERKAPTAERSALGAKLIADLTDVKVNLEYLIQMAEWYVQGQPHRIVEFQHKLRGPGGA